MEPQKKTIKDMDVLLKRYEDYVQAFTGTSKSISNIEENHGFLLQYWKNFVRESTNFLCGVFVIDIFEIYTPVQTNDFGLVGFRKYPFKRQRVFGLGDGFSSVYYKWKNFFVIFANVEKTPKGYMFKHIPISTSNSNKEIPTVPCTIYPITLSIPSKQEAFFISSEDFKEGSLDTAGDDNDDDEYTGEYHDDYIKKLRKNYASDSDDD